MKIKVKCPVCIVCLVSDRVEVDEDSYYKWVGGWDTPGVPIQEAFPNLDADQRELLMTGTHKECWDKFIKDVEDEANGEGQRV